MRASHISDNKEALGEALFGHFATVQVLKRALDKLKRALDELKRATTQTAFIYTQKSHMYA